MAKIHDSELSIFSGGLSQRVHAGTIAVLLGTFLLLGTGFAHSQLLHDAAHDTRHGFTFPCH